MTTSVMTPAQRREIERWFTRRGVPQLIDGYTAERRMDARAIPIVVGWLIVGTILFWGTRDDWPIALNVVGVIGTLAFIGLGIWGMQRIGGRWTPGREMPVAYILALGPIVALPAGLIHGSAIEGVSAGLGALTGIGVIYLVVGLGLVEIAWWGLGRLEGELLSIVGLLGRTLPLLLVLVLFLLFSTEIWEAAHALGTDELWVVLGLILAVAVVLVITSIWSEMADVEKGDRETMRALAASTPAAPLVGDGVPARVGVPPLGILQRLNLGALALIAQLVQSIFVAALVMAFLVVFGIIALPLELQERWIGEPTSALVRFQLLGEQRTISAELLTVTALLGAIVGLYFTGLAVTDSAYRPSHFGRIVDEVRKLVAARSVYAVALAEEGSPPATNS